MGRQQCSQPPGPPQLWSITQGTLWVWEVWLSGASGLTGRNMPPWADPLSALCPPSMRQPPEPGSCTCRPGFAFPAHPWLTDNCGSTIIP